jgi:hypothetical protein
MQEASQSTGSVWLRRAGVAAAFVLLLSLVAKPVWDAREQWQFGQGMDEGIYWVTAKALAHGDGYRVSNLPSQPYAIKYPPLYPLYLSIAWRLNPALPGNLRTAAWLQAALLPPYLALLLLVLRQMGCSWRRTLLIAALTLVNKPFLLVTIKLFSELLCGCFLLAAIWAIERSANPAGKRSYGWALAGGLLAGLAYLTRSAVLPIFLAVPIFYWVRKQIRMSVPFLAVALPLALAWHLWTFTHAGGNPDPTNGTYFHEYVHIIRAQGLWTTFVQQLSALSYYVADGCFPGVVEALHGIPLSHVFLAAAIAGGIRLGRRRHWPLFMILAPFYLILLLFWWFAGVDRLLLPVWPVLLAGIAEEAGHFAGVVEKTLSQRPVFIRQLPRWAMVLMAVCFVFLSGRVSASTVASSVRASRDMGVADQSTFSWLAHHAQPDTVVLAWRDTVSYLNSGIPSSHGLFVALMPLEDYAKPQGAASFSALPPQYRQAMLLLLRSDFPDGQLNSGRANAESIPRSSLEYSSPTALIYRFPIAR